MSAALEVEEPRKRFGEVTARRSATYSGGMRRRLDLAATLVVNPITLCVNAVRDLMLGGNATGAVLGTLAWLAGLLLNFVPLAVGRYRALE